LYIDKLLGLLNSFWKGFNFVQELT